MLDAERNRLTYYNSKEDTSSKGHIDLGKVRAKLKDPPLGAPKESRTYFEVSAYLYHIVKVNLSINPDRSSVPRLDRKLSGGSISTRKRLITLSGLTRHLLRCLDR